MAKDSKDKYVVTSSGSIRVNKDIYFQDSKVKKAISAISNQLFPRKAK